MSCGLCVTQNWIWILSLPVTLSDSLHLCESQVPPSSMIWTLEAWAEAHEAGSVWQAAGELV